MEKFSSKKAEHHYKCFMEALGIRTDTVHTKDTPARVTRMFRELTEGLREPKFTFTAFPKEPKHTYDQLVVVNNIPLFSLCAHHHTPYYGKAAVGYLPDKKIIGLSKIVRVVIWKARQPSIQEDLTEQIADLLVEELKPRAVCVLLRCEHLCISSRGVQQPGTETITHCLRGEGMNIKEEFLTLLGVK